jgi:hypothetical protein
MYADADDSANASSSQRSPPSKLLQRRVGSSDDSFIIDTDISKSNAADSGTSSPLCEGFVHDLHCSGNALMEKKLERLRAKKK